MRSCSEVTGTQEIAKSDNKSSEEPRQTPNEEYLEQLEIERTTCIHRTLCGSFPDYGNKANVARKDAK